MKAAYSTHKKGSDADKDKGTHRKMPSFRTSTNNINNTIQTSPRQQSIPYKQNNAIQPPPAILTSQQINAHRRLASNISNQSNNNNNGTPSSIKHQRMESNISQSSGINYNQKERKRFDSNQSYSNFEERSSYYKNKPLPVHSPSGSSGGYNKQNTFSSPMSSPQQNPMQQQQYIAPIEEDKEEEVYDIQQQQQVVKEEEEEEEEEYDDEDMYKAPTDLGVDSENGNGVGIEERYSSNIVAVDPMLDAQQFNFQQQMQQQDRI